MTARALANRIIKCFENGGKILICGNGGSATMSSHFAAELVSKFEVGWEKRSALPAISLCVDPAVITSIANDYGFEYVFERQLQALANPQDLLITLSTSGKSVNCVRALKYAKGYGMDFIDWPRCPGKTVGIQEFQLKLMHHVCELVERHYV